MPRQLFVAVAIVVLAASCSSGEDVLETGGTTAAPTSTSTTLEAEPDVDLADVTADDLSIDKGCYFGFAATNENESVGFVARTAVVPGELPAPGTHDLIAEGWRVDLESGSDLFSLWCDDVMEADTPTPVRIQRASLQSGTVDIAIGEGDVTGTFRDLVFSSDSGDSGDQVTIRSLVVVNQHWGTIPG